MTDNPRSIGDRIATGAFWTVGMRLSIRALGVVSVIILARILVPEDFGIVAKAAMIASVLEMIMEFGLDAALIHNRKATSAHYDTVWTIHVIRGSVIALILVALAKPAAVFFHEPVLSVILLFYALSSFINGLHNVGVVDFRKNLEFDRDFRFSLYHKTVEFCGHYRSCLCMEILLGICHWRTDRVSEWACCKLYDVRLPTQVSASGVEIVVPLFEMAIYKQSGFLAIDQARHVHT